MTKKTIDFTTWKTCIQKHMYHNEFSARSIALVDEVPDFWIEKYEEGLKWPEAFTEYVELCFDNMEL